MDVGCVTLLDLPLHIADVGRQLEELKRDALARGLRPDEDRQIAKPDVSFDDLADVLEL